MVAPSSPRETRHDPLIALNSRAYLSAKGLPPAPDAVFNRHKQPGAAARSPAADTRDLWVSQRLYRERLLIDSGESRNEVPRLAADGASSDLAASNAVIAVTAPAMREEIHDGHDDRFRVDYADVRRFSA